MDLDQNALSPTALAWDRNGELRSQEFQAWLGALPGGLVDQSAFALHCSFAPSYSHA